MQSPEAPVAVAHGAVDWTVLVLVVEVVLLVVVLVGAAVVRGIVVEVVVGMVLVVEVEDLVEEEIGVDDEVEGRVVVVGLDEVVVETTLVVVFENGAFEVVRALELDGVVVVCWERRLVL